MQYRHCGRQTSRLLIASVKSASRPTAGHRHLLLLFGVLVAIFLWQQSFANVSARLDSRYANKASVGVHHEGRFAYFLYYLNLFPVATTITNPPLSLDGAKDIVLRQPATLVQDLTYTWLSGDYGKVFPHLYDAWLKGAPWNVSMTPFNRMLFTLSLCTLFLSLWTVGRPQLGLLLVVLLGSNPFQLFEVHAHDNVHGLTISTAIIVLAAHIPVFRRAWRPHIYYWLLPVMTGVFVATIRMIRSEPAPIILAAMIAYLAAFPWSWKRRFLTVGLLGVAFLGSSLGWSKYFSGKFEESKSYLKQHGGHPFPGQLRLHHHFWHPIWCGLGDFDHKYGYVWSDKAALRYATPILEQEYKINVPVYDVEQRYPADEYFDEARVYKKLPFHIAEYDEVARRKVLRDIASDPVWYINIIAKRIWRVLDVTTPVRISWGTWRRRLPMHGAGMVLLALLLLVLKEGFLLRLLLFTLPTCITAVLIYSGDGTSYYGIYHLIGSAILVLIMWRMGELLVGSRAAVCTRVVKNLVRRLVHRPSLGDDHGKV